MELILNKKKIITHTLKHKFAFLKLEKQLTGKMSLWSFFHDVDKLILYLFLPKKIVHSIHRKLCFHHCENIFKRYDYFRMVLDWECARFTKPDKPLNAKDTCLKLYPEFQIKIFDEIKRLGL
jgi:hypothetical protein